MDTQTLNCSDILENGHMSEVLSDVYVHSCSICKLKFNRLADLELHCKLHDKNNDYKCLLCDDVFTDLEQLKVHDLRHSLEEAEEDVTDIEQMILPFGLKSCDICGEKFSCDEELINHTMNHPEALEDGIIDKEFSCDEEQMNHPEDVEDEILPEADSSKEDCASLDNEDGPTNYQILRQEIVKDANGRMDIRFILIDHQNEQVEEYTHTIHEQTKKATGRKQKTLPRSNVKRNGTIERSKKQKIRNKRVKSDSDMFSVNSDVDMVSVESDEDMISVKSDDNDVVFIKSKDGVIKKRIKSEDDVNSKYIKSEDNVSEDEELNNKSRRSKQIALKRKIWNEKVYLPPPQKLKDCPTCNKSFGDMDDFKKHLLMHKPKSEPLDEQSTSYSVVNKKAPKDQIKRTPIKLENDHYSDGESDYPEWIQIVCEICYNRFCRKKGLRKHLMNVHKLDLKKVNYYLEKVQHNTASYYVCKTCKKQFYRESRLRSHDCVPAIAVVCELCEQKLSSKSGLKRHLLSAHKLGESKTNSIMDQLANYNAKFYKKLNPVGEVAVSSSDGRLVSKKKDAKFNILQGSRCDTCYKTLTDEYELEGHKCFFKIEIKCEVCKYSPPSKYNLKRHLMRIHKLSLSDAEKAMSEFKCYNERLKLRYPVVGKKKNSCNKSMFSNVKSPSSKVTLPKDTTSSKSNSVISSKNTDKKKQDMKTRAKEILLTKGKKLLLSRNDPTKNFLKKAGSLSRRINVSGLSLSKKLNSSRPSSSKKPNLPRPSASKKSNLPRPSSSKKPNSSGPSSSKKSKLSRPSSTKKSNIAKKKEKMKHTSADTVKKVAAKNLITKSRNYLERNASSRLLRSNKK